MATRKVSPAPDDVQPGGAAWQVAVNEHDGGDAEGDAIEEMAIVDRIRTTLAQSGEGISIKLFRVDAFTKKREFCQNYAPHDLENIEERVREQWGAGTYEVKIFNSRGIAPGGRIMVTLAAPAKPQALAITAPAVPDAVALVLKQLADNQTVMMEAIARIGATPTQSPNEQMKATLELLTMARALTAAPAPAAAPGPNQAEMMREVFSMIREAKSAVKELAEDEPASDPDNPMSMVREFLATARGVMQHQAQAQPMQTLPAVSVPQSFSNEESSDMLNLQRHIAELESMLKRGEPPETAAQYLYQWLPAAMLPMLSGDSWFAILSSASPVLASNREWCDNARQATIKLFADAKNQGIL